MMFVAKARFGRHTEENILEKRDRIGAAGGTGSRHRAGLNPGWRVRLFEQRPFLAAAQRLTCCPTRAMSTIVKHVTLGCCTNLEDFYTRIGAAGKIKFFDRLLFLDPQGRRGEMHAGFLPAPFHLTGSFAAFRPLTLLDKFSIARALLDILRTKGKPSDLQENGASPCSNGSAAAAKRNAHRTFLRVVLISALDEELDRTDARFGRRRFLESLPLQ